MSAEMYAAIELVIRGYAEKNNGRVYFLPIEMFDTFKVTVWIKSFWCQANAQANRILKFSYEIACDNIMMDCGNNWVLSSSHGVNSVAGCFDQMGLTKLLQEGCFNKINGRLEMPEFNCGCNAAKVAKFLEGPQFKRVKLSIQDCCVCGEATGTRTECGHFLCLSCVSQLVCFENLEDGDTNCRKCPICRANFGYCIR